MEYFKIAKSISEIIEHSSISPTIIFKYSSECGSSDRLSKELTKKIVDKTLQYPVYVVVVQKQPSLSQKIEEVFEVKHESPQIVIINKGKLTYTAHHNSIKIENFNFV